MTVFTVTNLFDSGAGSLRNAINMSNSMVGIDTINFDNSLSGGIIKLTSGELPITDSLAINGLGANLLTIDAQSLGFRVFNVDNGTDNLIDVSLGGLTITGGLVTTDRSFLNDSGGGIANRENLAVIDSTISSNQSASGYGGGLVNFGTTTIANSTISDNLSLSPSYGRLRAIAISRVFS